MRLCTWATTVVFIGGTVGDACGQECADPSGGSTVVAAAQDAGVGGGYSPPTGKARLWDLGKAFQEKTLTRARACVNGRGVDRGPDSM